MDDSICGILGCDVVTPGDNFLFEIGNIVRTLLSLTFAAIIAYGIFIIIKAVIKIITSEGDAGKYESGLKSIKGVYLGIIMIFVGLIGMVIIFALFNFTEIPSAPDVPGLVTDPFN